MVGVRWRCAMAVCDGGVRRRCAMAVCDGGVRRLCATTVCDDFVRRLEISHLSGSTMILHEITIWPMLCAANSTLNPKNTLTKSLAHVLYEFLKSRAKNRTQKKQSCRWWRTRELPPATEFRLALVTKTTRWVTMCVIWLYMCNVYIYIYIYISNIQYINNI